MRTPIKLHTWIDIHLDDCLKIYSTMDVIKGVVTIKPHADTHIEQIDISLNGTSKTHGTRICTVGAIERAPVTSHIFLTLFQPDLRRQCPAEGILKAGEMHRLYFIFKVPERLAEGACDHEVLGSHVRDAHLLLPPTLGDQGSSKRHDYLDDMTPDMTMVEYRISARLAGLMEDVKGSRESVIATRSRPVRIIPLLELAPPVDASRPINACVLGDSISRSENRINTGLFRSFTGTVVMEASQPVVLHLSWQLTSMEAATLVPVSLRFDPAQDTAQPPPLVRIVSKLETHNYYTTDVYQDFPREHECMFKTDRGCYTKHVGLASRTLSSIQWFPDADNADHHRHESHRLFSAKEGWIPKPSLTHRPWTIAHWAHILLPVELPPNMTILPTFHSCLISRTYTLCITLEQPISCFGSSPRLRLPVQVSSRFSTA